MKLSVLSDILRGIWLLDQTQGDFLPFVQAGLMRDISMLNGISKGAAPLMYMDDDGNAHEEEAPEVVKSVVVIPVTDVIIKYSQECGPVGTETINRHLKTALQNENIAGAVLKFDTPGGAANGVENLSHTIKNSSKPIIGFVDGMMCSGGTWIGSHCKEVYSFNHNNVIGSIGAYTTIVNLIEYYESMGVKITDIYATQSSEKNRAYRDALEGNFKRLQESIDELAANFISVVKTNLPGVNAEVFKGGTFNTDEAIEMGLITGKKDLEECVARVFELAEEGEKSNTNSNQKSSNMFGKNKFPQLGKMAATAAEERTSEMVEAVNQELQSAGIEAVIMELHDAAAIEEQIAANTQLSEQLGTAQAELATAQETHTSLISEIAAAVGAEEGADVLEAVRAVVAEREEFSKLAYPGEAVIKNKADDMGEGEPAKTLSDQEVQIQNSLPDNL